MTKNQAMIVEDKSQQIIKIRKQLKTECQKLSEQIWWKCQLEKEAIYSQELKTSRWIALIFGRYHQKEVEAIQTLPPTAHFFCQNQVNRFRRVSRWCVKREALNLVVRQLSARGGNLNLKPLELNYAHH